MSNYLAVILFSLFGSWAFISPNLVEITPANPNSTPTDSVSKFLSYAYTPVDTPPPNPNNGPGDPTTRDFSSPWNLENPSNVEVIYELDEEGDGYYIHEQVGGFDIRPPSYITMAEYLKMRREQGIRDYFNERSANTTATTGGGILDPQFPLPEGLKDIFGGGAVEIKPNGTALLDLAAEINRMENPSLPIRQQRTANFRFDQQIQLNVVGKIGEKLRLNANWDTQATFDFENQLKLNYSGSEDEILQKIEAGNVSLPLNGSLIQGGQNLFGVKVAMKFGPLTVTTIASQQKGKTKTLTATGGSQVTEFEKKGNEYDEYRHFFLAHYFRNRYETALKSPPNINSPITITRVEVYITNNNSSSTVNNRNGVGFIDLGETNRVPTGSNVTGVLFNPGQIADFPSFPDNKANNLYARIDSATLAQEKSTVENYLENDLNLENGIDYVMNENMRRLNDNEFTFHPQLGYVSLNSQLQANQVLFVAFQYMVGGKVYQVGDFSNDQGKQANATNSNVLFLKMVKPSTVKPQHDGETYPTWDLMMKNIYNIGGYGLRDDNFRLTIEYESGTSAGTISTLPDGPIKDKQLIQVFGMDNLQNNSMQGADNIFDFIPGLTIIPDKGLIIFPVLEPFGDHLEGELNNDEASIERYVFHELYEKTRADAINLHIEKDRFYIKGSYQSASSSEISLNSINVTQGSVVVTANGITLTEGVDYQVDYNIGKVTILNQGILTSGQELQINFETNSLFGIESKTLVGSRFDLDVSKDIQLGATMLLLNERPLINKINIGDEPLRNFIAGFDGVMRKESRWLTKMIDKLPGLQTKEISTITAQGEVAVLKPGSPKAIKVDGENGIAYLDDFESAKTTFDLSGARSWTLASYPGDNGNNDMVPPDPDYNPALSPGFTRAKLAWYSIDPSFYYQTTNENFPEADLSNHYTRQVRPTEVFPQQTVLNGDNLQRTFDLHFLPQKKGPYNYNADPLWLDADGTFRNPEDTWAGIQRRTSGNTDFEANNFEFIEFWMMDPFIYNQQNGGEFYLNLGQISEDVVKDGRRNFENGLPPDASGTVQTNVSEWGYAPVTTPPTNAFNNDAESREYQDVGLDGVRNDEEAAFFAGYIDTLSDRFPGSQLLQEALEDPSGDRYQYFRGDQWDNRGILDRYLDFNGHEGNTPINSTQNGYSTQGSPNPDTEDINLNGTLNSYEEYFEYKMNLSPSEMQVGRNFIVDINTQNVNLTNGNTETINWYQFRIPLAAGKPINGIQNFKAIEFVRMYMKDWQDEVVMRFARFQLVSTTWRTYRQYLGAEGDTTGLEPPVNLTSFEIGTVNREENSGRLPFNYVLPPKVDRQIQVGSPQANLRQNEQALVMKVCNLEDGDARAAYKLANYDLRSYNRLKMWIHAEQIEGSTQDFQPGELRAFIRLGTDITQNYYEYEIPLRSSTPGDQSRENVWLDYNHMQFDLATLNIAKAKRNEEAYPYDSRYEYIDTAGNSVYVRGTPKLSEVKAMMIGVRNADDGQGPVCAEVWMNELRVTDFDQSVGWAANARVNMKLADWGTVTLSGSKKTPGFGGIEQPINQRSREDVTQYDVAGNFQMGKFFPKNWGLEIPLYMTYGERIVNPQFNPLESDVLMPAYLETFPTEDEKTTRLNQVQDYTRNKSISVNNVRKIRVREENVRPDQNRGRPDRGRPQEEKSQGNKGPKTHPWDIENLAASFSYNETYHRDHRTTERWQKNHRASLKYNYNFNPKPIEPFKGAKKRNIITAFNFYPLPKTLAVSVSGDRRFEENTVRPTAGQASIPTTFYKNFNITRNYNLRWDLTKSLSFNFQANNTARVDETVGEPKSNSRDSLLTNLLSIGRRVQDDTLRDSLGYWQQGKDKYINFGRNTRYTHQWGANYILPFDKFPMTNFISSTVSYQGQFNWGVGPDNNPQLGNMASNSYTINGTARLNLKNLYNKVPGIRKLLQEQPKKDKKTNPKWEKGPTGRKDPNDPKASEGKEGEKEGEEEEEEEDTFAFLKNLGKGLAKILLSVQNIEGNYSRNMATDMPGYLGNTDNFGMDFNYRDNNGIQSPVVPPTLGFVAGLQPGDPFSLDGASTSAWLDRAGTYGWMSTSPEMATPFRQNFGEQLTGRTSVTLFKDFRVDLNITKNSSKSYTELFRWDTLSQAYFHENQLETGSYSISYIFAGTTFRREKDFSGPLYELENNYRRIIAERFAAEHGPGFITSNAAGQVTSDVTSDLYPQGYYKNNPDVLIPAFLSAYSVAKPEKIKLTDKNGKINSAFPAIPLPNWNVNYNGLSKIPMFQHIFQSVTLKHGYRGTYNVGNYQSNPLFEADQAGYDNSFTGVGIDPNPIPNPDSIYNYLSPYQIQTVSFQEAWSPLIGINMQFQNNLTASVDFKATRNLSLSVGNQQLTETRTKDLSISFGYRIDKLNKTLKLGAREIKLENSLNSRLEISLRDTKTQNIILDSGADPDVTAGNFMLIVKPSVDYVVNTKLNVRFYIEHSRNRPAISTSFPSSYTAIGFQVRFTLAQ